MMNIYANTGAKMAADLQVFSSDRYSCTYPVPAQLYASCNTSALLPSLLQPYLPNVFLYCLSFEGLIFALDTAIVCYAKYMFLYEYICPQQIRVYLIQSFPVQS